MRNHGWTLTGLLLAVALAALLAGLAAPTFSGLLADLRRSTTLTLVHGALHGARRLAAAHGRPVFLCALEADGRCSGVRDWSGYLLAVLEEPDGPPLRTWSLPRLAPGARLHSNRAVIQFSPLPASATPATLLYCDPRGSGFSGAVILSNSGRPRLALGTQLSEPAECS